MFWLIRVIGSYLYLWFEGIKGEGLFAEMPVIRDTSSLTAFSLDGYDITVHANRRDYHYRFVRRMVPRRHYSLFTVFSVVSIDAPDYLKEVCSFQVVLPPLHPWFVSERVQREAVIRAYLDLLIARAHSRKVRHS